MYINGVDKKNSWHVKTDNDDGSINQVEIFYPPHDTMGRPWSGEYKLKFHNREIVKYFVMNGKLPLEDAATVMPLSFKLSPNNLVDIRPGYDFQTCLKVLSYRNVSFDMALRENLVSCDASAESRAHCNITNAYYDNADGNVVLTLNVQPESFPAFHLKFFPLGLNSDDVSFWAEHSLSLIHI